MPRQRVLRRNFLQACLRNCDLTEHQRLQLSAIWIVLEMNFAAELLARRYLQVFESMSSTWRKLSLTSQASTTSIRSFATAMETSRRSGDRLNAAQNASNTSTTPRRKSQSWTSL